MSLLQSGDHEGALAVFADLVDKHPFAAEVLVQAGQAAMELGRITDAMAWLDRARSVEPANFWPFWLMSQLQARSGDGVASLATLSKAMEACSGKVTELEYANLAKALVDLKLARALPPDTVLASRLSQAPQAGKPLERALAVLLVKDVGDIIHANLSWCHKLGFRRFVLADNNSGDDTLAEVERFRREHQDCLTYVVSDPVAAHHQAAKTMALARLGSTIMDAIGPAVDWVFPLDADEFLHPCEPALDLDSILHEADRQACNLVAYPLVNFAPAIVHQAVRVQGDPAALFPNMMPLKESCIRKVAFRNRPGAFLEPGAHYCAGCVTKESEVLIGPQLGLVLRHYPLRSIEQVRSKIANGGKAMADIPATDAVGFHWREDYRLYLSAGEDYIRQKLRHAMGMATIAGADHAAGLPAGDTLHPPARSRGSQELMTRHAPDGAPPPAGVPAPAAVGTPSLVRKPLSRAFDVLAMDQAWTVDKQRRLDAQRFFKPTKTAAVVASARDEGVYLLEWLAHHRAVGFEHAFIYTNDNRDGSGVLYDVLDQHGVITCRRNEVGPGVPPQIKAYEHSIHHLSALREYEWVAYLDIDEFLVPSATHGHSVTQLAQAAKAAYAVRPPSVIYFNWRWFGSNGRIAYEPGLVQARFQHAIPHVIVKSLVRLPDVRSMRHIHVPALVEGFGVNSTLQPAQPGSLYNIDCAYEGGEIRHYYQKSFAEFCLKRNRGEGSEPKGQTGKPFSTFFTADVRVQPSNRAPPLPSLRRRTAQELARLRALPGVAEAERHVQEMHRLLLETIVGDGLEAEYARQKEAVEKPFQFSPEEPGARRQRPKLPRPARNATARQSPS